MANKNILTKLIRKDVFISIFILLSILIYFILAHNNKVNVQKHLNNKSEQVYLEYKVVYDSFKTLADLIYKTSINQEKVINLFKNRKRGELKKYLDDIYIKLREYNLRQLHFHLPNNDSFLRMHRPKKFGDNLTKARHTVAFVNKYKKYVHGFEEGKIFNGFRFVYPVFDKYQHIGSVEVSFSSLFFIKDIMKNYSVTSNLLISKKVVETKVFNDEKSNYVQSPLKEFYFQKAIVDYIKLEPHNVTIPDKFAKNIIDNIYKGNYFSKYIKKYNHIVTFIPLINPITLDVVGALTVKSDDTYIQNQFKYKYILLFFILLSLGAILIFIYKQFSYQLNLENEVNKKTKELQDFNASLKDKINEEIEKNLKKDKLVQEQSKLASMGEMIGSIAHQWRQPLNALNINIQNLDDDYDDGLIDRKFIENYISKNRRIISFMSQTIDDFRNFFRVDKEKKEFSVKEAIENVLNIQSAMFIEHKISLDIEGEDFTHFGLYTEFQQVLLNIINNAKDQIVENKIEEGKITITLKDNHIFIKDNAGGINESIINRIFEPYFTTKEEGKGTGMGLYISKLIVENMNGKLKIENSLLGATFIIDFKGDSDE
jgi:signal transduction histidine kinase